MPRISWTASVAALAATASLVHGEVMWTDTYYGSDLLLSSAHGLSVHPKTQESCTCVIMRGNSSAPYIIGDYSFTWPGIGSAAVVKRSAAGDVLWATQIEGEVFATCLDVKIDHRGNCVAVGTAPSQLLTIGEWSFPNPSPPLPPLPDGRVRRMREDRRTQGRGRGLGAFHGKANSNGNYFTLEGFAGQAEARAAAAVTFYPRVGYIAVLDGSTGKVLQADGLAGEETNAYPITLELHKGFAYISGAVEYIGDGIDFSLNGFPQSAHGGEDMLFARVHLKTMEWKYVDTVGGIADEEVYLSTMDGKGNWYVGAFVNSPLVNGLGKRGEALDTDEGDNCNVVAHVSKRTGDITSFHNFGGELEEYTVGNETAFTNYATMIDITSGKGGLYVVGYYDGEAWFGQDRKGNDVTLDNTPDRTLIFTDDAFALKLKPSAWKEWPVLGVSGFGTPISAEGFMAAAVGSDGDLYAYLISDADELDVGPLTLENEFAGAEFQVFVPMSAIVKLDYKTLDTIKGIQSVNTLLENNAYWMDVDKYGYTYVSGGPVLGDFDEASRTICNETFLLGPGDIGPLQMKLSSLDCLEAKCRAGKGCIS